MQEHKNFLDDVYRAYNLLSVFFGVERIVTEYILGNECEYKMVYIMVHNEQNTFLHLTKQAALLSTEDKNIVRWANERNLDWKNLTKDDLSIFMFENNILS